MEKKEFLKGAWERWTRLLSVEKKIHIVILAVIVGMTVIAIGVSTVSTISTIMKQSEESVTDQLATMAAECDENLKQYKAIMIAMVRDEYVQEYVSSRTVEEANLAAGNTYDVLSNILYMLSNANFAAVVNDELDIFAFSSNTSLFGTGFESVYLKKRDSQQAAAGSLAFEFSDDYFQGKKYTVTLTFPAYSTTRIGVCNGVVVLNVDDNLLSGMQSRRAPVPGARMYMTDTQGMIVTGAHGQDDTISYADRLTGKAGHFHEGGRLVNYQKIGNWDYFLVNETPVGYFFGNCVPTILILLASMGILMVLALTISGKLIGRLYQPIRRVVEKMHDVSQGDLRTRITDIGQDSDSQKLAAGFNVMMDEIDVLIGQMKEEQKQLAQMELDRLQSQIQPHFLYNTLECIHWQAASDGNSEVSTMIKALAKYYRLSLSRGEDIVSLELELQHISNYLIIQNMRYGDIIDLEIDVPEQYRGIRLPKITLQPLVENSIYHGIRVREGRCGRIRIYTEQRGTDFCIVVRDNGEGMTQEQIEHINEQISDFDRSIGYGVNNVNRRIELMFGPEYGLGYEKNPDGGVDVRIRLPGAMEEA